MTDNTVAGKQWQCGRFVFDCRQPLIMGIVNTTPDSFSDGGRFANAETALAHGLSLLAAGADIVDVGGESTRPGASLVDAESEKRRILPIIEKLAAQGAAVSADTMKPAVMDAAMQCGAAILNDVSGFSTAASVAVAAAHQCGVVIMHMQGAPQTMQQSPHYADVAGEVGAFLQRRAQYLIDAGVAAARICLDPGIGFGKTVEHNLQLLRCLPQVGGAYPVLVGVSRKSFLGAIGGGAQPLLRDVGSAVAAAILSQQGATVLRVHNVAATREALAVVRALSVR